MVEVFMPLNVAIVDVITKHADLLDAIRASKDLSSDSEAKLKDVVQNFAKSFS